MDLLLTALLLISGIGIGIVARNAKTIGNTRQLITLVPIICTMFLLANLADHGYSHFPPITALAGGAVIAVFLPQKAISLMQSPSRGNL